jgi:plasmid stabilization system protein ParE
MSAYVFTPEAEMDLFEIWSHIAQDSRESADRVESELYKACRLLGSKPYTGHSRPDLTTRPVRFWTVPRFARYVVVYDLEKKTVSLRTRKSPDLGKVPRSMENAQNL